MRGGDQNAVQKTQNASSANDPSHAARPSPPSAPAPYRVQDVKCFDPYIPGGGLAFPCGQCEACRSNRRRIWTHRIMLEALQHELNSFVTLTYGDAPANGSLDPAHIQKWLKRFRKRIYPRAIRYFVCGEYGPATKRPHYHGALFGFGPCVGGISRSVVGGGRECLCCQCSVVRETWGFGHTMLGTLEMRSAQYIAGYVLKKMSMESVQTNLVAPFARMSLRPGIGATAIPDVASVMMQYRLENTLPDVPASLRHGSRVMPVGRYLRRLLRAQVGLPMEAPDATIEALRQGLLPVYASAALATSAPGTSRIRSALFKKLLVDANRQAAINLTSRDKIHNRRTL